MLKKILKTLDQKCSMYTLGKIICVLVILYLLMRTQSFWGSWANLLLSIFQPFMIGFVLAYVMHPLVLFLEKKGITKNFSIIVIWGCILFLLIMMLVVLLPMLYGKINGFMVSMVDGVVWISEKIKTLGNMKDFSLVNSMTDNIVNVLESYDNWLPQLMSSLPGLMNTVLNVVTNSLFSIIIAIYMLFDFERIKNTIRKFVHLFFKNSDLYLHEIDQNVAVYLKSLFILMLIKFVEYSAFYFMIGHKDWLVIGILTSFGAIVPYLGGTIANSIGIITALTLPTKSIVALIVGIMVLSNVDAYVISPMVHEKRSALGPLVTLFAVFAGGVLMGAIGIMISVPFAIAVKTVFEVYEQQSDQTLYERAMEVDEEEAV